MCIIALTTKGKLVKKEKLLNMTRNNSHGFGISWIENGKVKTFKSMDSKKFIEKAIDIQSEFYNESEILIHCRIATSGTTDINNCHPFAVDNDTVFAHNGVFDEDVAEGTATKSDTRIFNERFLRNLKPNFLKTRAMRNIIGELIDSDNKLAFLTVNKDLDKNAYIINKNQGEIDDGIWYSNGSHRERTFVSSWERSWRISESDLNDPYYERMRVNQCEIDGVNDDEDMILIEQLSELAEFIHDESVEIIMERDPELGDTYDESTDYMYPNGRTQYTDIMSLTDKDYISLYMHVWGELPIIHIKDKKQMEFKLNKTK